VAERQALHAAGEHRHLQTLLALRGRHRRRAAEQPASVTGGATLSDERRRASRPLARTAGTIRTEQPAQQPAHERQRQHRHAHAPRIGHDGHQPRRNQRSAAGRAVLLLDLRPRPSR
jgi:hypothetical protein